MLPFRGKSRNVFGLVNSDAESMSGALIGAVRSFTLARMSSCFRGCYRRIQGRPSNLGSPVESSSEHDTGAAPRDAGAATRSKAVPLAASCSPTPLRGAGPAVAPVAPVAPKLAPWERYRRVHQDPHADRHSHGPGLGSVVWFSFVAVAFGGWHFIRSDPLLTDGILEPAIERRHRPGNIRPIEGGTT